MNYRHAFHAGGFADVMKHALLVRLVRGLLRKPAPFAVLDTHAGVGRYELDIGPATRTGEWRAGIGQLLENPPPPLADYVQIVRARLYPGSPMLVRALLRPDDRLICCELHPEDAASLRRLFARDPQVAVHHRDGYEAVGALLPPVQRRGLVLLDPPYERADEFARVVAALEAARHRFPAGVLAAWYPIKHRAPVRAFHDSLRASGLRDLVVAELLLHEPLNASRLNGAGLLVSAPPFGFEPAAAEILTSLAERLGGNSGEVVRLVDE